MRSPHLKAVASASGRILLVWAKALIGNRTDMTRSGPVAAETILGFFMHSSSGESLPAIRPMVQIVYLYT